MLSVLRQRASVGLPKTLPMLKMSRMPQISQHSIQLSRSFLLMRALSLGGKTQPRRANTLLLCSQMLINSRSYIRRTPMSNKPTHRIKYLALMFAASWLLLLFVTSQVDKKAPKTSFSNREYEAYEKESGLRRRKKLITPEQKERFKFYAVPFSTDGKKSEKAFAKALNPDIAQKVIEPSALIAKELEEEGKYSYLLEDLKASGRLMPAGLLTALVKQEIQLFTNTTKGQFDTNIILLNYPQTTEEAIKFENDVADFDACVVTTDDYEKNLSKTDDTSRRNLNNVYGYFDVLNKFKKLGQDKLE